MDRNKAAELVDYMEQLWSKWNPTDAQRTIWVKALLSHDEPEHAREALKTAYAESRYLVPRVGDYRNALSVLAGSSAPDGVYETRASGAPKVCPLFIMELGVDPLRKRWRYLVPNQKTEYYMENGVQRARPLLYSESKPRYYTWVYKFGLPDENTILQDARRMLSWTERLRPHGGGWIIVDARQPPVNASDHLLDVCWLIREKIEAA